MVRTRLPIPVFVAAVLLTGLLEFSASAAPASSPAPAPAAKAPMASASPAAVLPSNTPDEVATQLQDAVAASEKSLGGLTPQQKKIFDEEVIPDYRLFVKDFSRDGQAIHAQVDLDGIRSITRFSAPLGAKILLYLNVDPHCDKCTASAEAVRKMMEARVERRGFAPLWVARDELAASSIADLVAPRAAMGYLQMELVPAPFDQLEGDTRYFAKTELSVRGVTSYQDQAELFETDSFETQSDKLLTHAFTDLGSKADLAGISTLEKDDLNIEIGKIADFTEYSRLRDGIASTLKGLAIVEQRKLSRGKAVFALRTRKTADEIRSLLKTVQLDGKRQLVMLNTPGANGQSIEMEMR